MQTKDAIKFSSETAHQAVITLIDDMSDAPLTFPTPNGGNHPLWTLGHLAYAEGLIPVVLFGEANPVEHWHDLFSFGSQPVADADKYPAFGEVRETFEKLYRANLQVLDSLSEADLDKPTKSQPPGLEELFATYGSSFLTLALHQMSHRGQVADARRAAGRQPLFA